MRPELTLHNDAGRTNGENGQERDKRNRTTNCEDNHEVDGDKRKIDQRSQRR